MTIDLVFTGSPIVGAFMVDRVDVVDRAQDLLATLYLGNAPDAPPFIPLVGTPCVTRVALPAPLAGRPVMDGYTRAVRHELLGEWRDRVEMVERGAAGPEIEMMLGCRDELEEALGLLEPGEDQWLRAEVATLDDRYRAATQELVTDRGGGWWHQRAPLVMDTTGELANENAEIARAYADEHAREFGGLLFEPGPPHVCIVFFTDHVGEHERALRQLVPHPELLSVRRSRFGEADLEAMREELDGFIDVTPYTHAPRYGAEGAVVEVDLPAGSADLAHRLEQRFGERVAVEVHDDWVPQPRPR